MPSIEAFRAIRPVEIDLNEHDEIVIVQEGQEVVIPADRWQSVVRAVRDLTKAAE
jgi:virulence-associated protein VagC